MEMPTQHLTTDFNLTEPQAENLQNKLLSSAAIRVWDLEGTRTILEFKCSSTGIYNHSENSLQLFTVQYKATQQICKFCKFSKATMIPLNLQNPGSFTQFVPNYKLALDSFLDCWVLDQFEHCFVIYGSTAFLSLNLGVMVW